MSDLRGRKPVISDIKAIRTPAGNKIEDRSTATRLAKGTNGSLILTNPLPEPPTPPTSLQEGGRGLEYWNLYWRAAQDWLTESDLPLVARLCELWDRYTLLNARMMADGGPTVLRKTIPNKGLNVAHPLLHELDRLMPLMERLEGDLGFNPVDRSRIRIERGEKGSALDQWQRDRAARKTA